jgi:HSP20 family molecular chaperone IbpA
MKVSQHAEPSAPPPHPPSNSCQPVAFHDLTDCLLEAYDAVAQRAYEIFRERGNRSGGELEDWRRAEQDVLQKLSVDLQESEHAITALAGVPGCTAQQLEIGVESDWMVIHGWREDSDSLADQSQFEYENFGRGFDEWNLEEINRSFDRPPGSSSRLSRLPLSAHSSSAHAPNSPCGSHPPLGPGELLQRPERSASSRQIFAVVRLPARVDQSRSCAFLHDGLLGIRMLKIHAGSRHRPFRSGFPKM